MIRVKKRQRTMTMRTAFLKVPTKSDSKVWWPPLAWGPKTTTMLRRCLKSNREKTIKINCISRRRRSWKLDLTRVKSRLLRWPKKWSKWTKWSPINPPLNFPRVSGRAKSLSTWKTSLYWFQTRKPHLSPYTLAWLRVCLTLVKASGLFWGLISICLGVLPWSTRQWMTQTTLLWSISPWKVFLAMTDLCKPQRKSKNVWRILSRWSPISRQKQTIKTR